SRSNAGTLEPGEPQHALALAGELIGGGHKACAIDRLHLAAGGLLSVAVLKDDFGRALDEDDLLAIHALMERRHELALRLVRDGAEGGGGSELSGSVHAELGCKRIERRLGRVALHFPRALLLE